MIFSDNRQLLQQRRRLYRSVRRVSGIGLGVGQRVFDLGGLEQNELIADGLKLPDVFLIREEVANTVGRLNSACPLCFQKPAISMVVTDGNPCQLMAGG